MQKEDLRVIRINCCRTRVVPIRRRECWTGRVRYRTERMTDAVSDYRETGISMVCGTTVSVYRMGVGENAIFGLYEWKCRGNCAGCRIVSARAVIQISELSAQIEAKLWTQARKMEAGAGFSDEGEMPLAGMAHGNSGFLMAYAALLKMLEQAGDMDEKVREYRRRNIRIRFYSCYLMKTACTPKNSRIGSDWSRKRKATCHECLVSWRTGCAAVPHGTGKVYGFRTDTAGHPAVGKGSLYAGTGRPYLPVTWDRRTSSHHEKVPF